VGSIQVRSTLTFASTDKDLGLLIFSFKDTGIGIPKSEMDNLFKPFFQVDSSESRSYGGTGLGLSITRKLVELMDGRIQVHSELLKGSEFIVTLPVECQREDALSLELAVHEPSKPRRTLTDLKVLLVDDNEMIRAVYSALIQSLGCHCVLAKNGLEAIESFKKEKFDVILMDCHMPILDGFAAASELRHLESLTPSIESTPIVALSASLSEQDRLRGFEVGMNDFCTKPIKRQILEDLLVRLCLIDPD
jgi:CheY-like chemotaxis protein